MKDSQVRLLSRLHRVLYQATGGVIGRRLVANDMLLLTTTGRRRGEPHTVPLLYLRESNRYVVIASFGGRSYHPAWYLNLTANPEVQVQIRSLRFPAVARLATPDERAVWWPRVAKTYHGYAAYQKRTDRIIPVVFLDAV